MRVLVTFDGRHRVYQDTISRAIREYRPHVEVATAELGEFEAEMACLDPHLFICGRPNTGSPNGRPARPAWVEVPSDPDQLAAICLDGEYSESGNPGLNELLRIVDETERLAWEKRDLGNC